MASLADCSPTQGKQSEALKHVSQLQGPSCSLNCWDAAAQRGVRVKFGVLWVPRFCHATTACRQQ